MFQSKQNTKDLSNREILDMLIIYKDARRKTKQ